MDIAFPPCRMPNIYSAVVVKVQDTVGQQINMTCEFYRRFNARSGSYRHYGSFKNFSRRSTLRRAFNIPEESVDNSDPVNTHTICSIHRSMLAFTQLDARLSMGVGVGETVLIVKLINNIPKAQWGISVFGEVRNNVFPGGHQPPLITKMSSLEEKNYFYKTRVHNFDSNNLADPAPMMTFAHLDATTILSRGLATKGIYTIVDPLCSMSIMLQPRIIGDEHYKITCANLTHYKELHNNITILRLDKLPKEDHEATAKAMNSEMEVKEIILPTNSVQIDVLPMQTPITTAVDIRILRICLNDEWLTMALMCNFARIGNNEIIVLANKAKRGDHIDPQEPNKPLKKRKLT
ncbi:LOW QUALITY PROTEIN: hypothetical protein Cgig2_012342 [Carnegiea gigantea]|uniref:H(+)-transporting two-sector ATPase n=1 Tax=Carnegiea gigantea TaxID=171969 RepID=A0A9Q1JQJ6_9CARY|nr:LOW QUALITY PROTEIN: hypothetical protein Cgig2_012342 [Carnegiea gigantea]